LFGNLEDLYHEGVISSLLPDKHISFRSGRVKDEVRLRRKRFPCAVKRKEHLPYCKVAETISNGLKAFCFAVRIKKLLGSKQASAGMLPAQLITNVHFFSLTLPAAVCMGTHFFRTFEAIRSKGQLPSCVQSPDKEQSTSGQRTSMALTVTSWAMCGPCTATACT